MPHWLLKSASHRLLSWLPNRDRWYGWFQEHVTGSLTLNPGAFGGSLDHCRRHLNAVFSERATSAPFTVLEVGTGWYPILPVAMYLCGAAEVWSYDITPLLRADRVRQTLEFFREFARDGRLQTHLPWLQAERLGTLDDALQQTSPAEMLARVHVHVRVGDASESGLSENSVDFFFSHSVFQYIPLPALDGLLAEFSRVGRPGAIHSHHIHPGDQFALFDRRLNALNFLRYTARQWHRLDSPFIPQTRLRISDYRAAFQRAGLQITGEDNRGAPPDELRRLRLAPEFRSYTEDDLRVVSTWITAMQK
jgi:hypothetical protein